MKVLITGASGFLGSALVAAFCNQKNHLLLVGRRGFGSTRIDAFKEKVSVATYLCLDEINEIIQDFKPEVVIHTACCYGRMNESSVSLVRANIEYGTAILDALLQLDNNALFINIGTALPSDQGLYALTKNAFSEIGKLLVNNSSPKIKFIDVKLQHIFGPGDDSSKFVTHLIRSCLMNVDELQMTSGEQIRDFVYIEDAVAAIETLVMKRHQLDAYVCVEIGSGHGIRIKDLAEKIKLLTVANTKLAFGARPYRRNEIMKCVADVEFIKNLGWNPRYSLDLGLNKTIELESK